MEAATRAGKHGVIDLTGEKRKIVVPASPRRRTRPSQQAEPVTTHTCQICLKEGVPSAKLTVSACGHSCCVKCAETYVKEQISSSKIPIVCPFCLTGDQACTKQCKARKPAGAPVHDWCCSLDADLGQLLSSHELTQYETRAPAAAALRSGGDLQSCPRAGCQGLAVKEPGERALVCSTCHHQWCRRCGTPDMHPGRSCEQVRQQRSSEPADASFRQYTAYHRTISCKGCGHGLQKSDNGCNHIMCAVCDSHMCWGCEELKPCACDQCLVNSLLGGSAARHNTPRAGQQGSGRGTGQQGSSRGTAARGGSGAWQRRLQLAGAQIIFVHGQSEEEIGEAVAAALGRSRRRAAPSRASGSSNRAGGRRSSGAGAGSRGGSRSRRAPGAFTGASHRLGGR